MHLFQVEPNPSLIWLNRVLIVVLESSLFLSLFLSYAFNKHFNIKK